MKFALVMTYQRLGGGCVIFSKLICWVVETDQLVYSEKGRSRKWSFGNPVNPIPGYGHGIIRIAFLRQLYSVMQPLLHHTHVSMSSQCNAAIATSYSRVHVQPV